MTVKNENDDCSYLAKFVTRIVLAADVWVSAFKRVLLPKAVSGLSWRRMGEEDVWSLVILKMPLCKRSTLCAKGQGFL